MWDLTTILHRWSEHLIQWLTMILYVAIFHRLRPLYSLLRYVAMWFHLSHSLQLNPIRWSIRSNGYCALTLHFLVHLFVWVICHSSMVHCGFYCFNGSRPSTIPLWDSLLSLVSCLFDHCYSRTLLWTFNRFNDPLQSSVSFFFSVFLNYACIHMLYRILWFIHNSSFDTQTTHLYNFRINLCIYIKKHLHSLTIFSLIPLFTIYP